MAITGVIRPSGKKTIVNTTNLSATKIIPPRTVMSTPNIRNIGEEGPRGGPGGGGGSSSSGGSSSVINRLPTSIIKQPVLNVVTKPKINPLVFRPKKIRGFINNTTRKKMVRCPFDPRFLLGDPRCKRKHSKGGKKK